MKYYYSIDEVQLVGMSNVIQKILTSLPGQSIQSYPVTISHMCWIYEIDGINIVNDQMFYIDKNKLTFDKFKNKIDFFLKR